MRKPDQIEYGYLDADGFFASVHQQIEPRLRGRPVGVIPFETDTDYTCIIACSKEAKAQGVKNVMSVREARAICPDIVLVPQNPDIYRRAHNAMCSSIESVIPIEARKSIDELTFRLDRKDQTNPDVLTHHIKRAIAGDIGNYITCSIGYAANRHLAKIACKENKPNGMTIWHPEIMPKPLLPLPFDDIPGIGGRMSIRLWKAGIYNMTSVLALDPKHMRKLWRNVTGERLWYALHGYDIKAQASERGMYGHGRVLSPDMRSPSNAYACVRLLTIKAVRRMRRDGYNASSYHLWMSYRIAPGKDKSWGGRVKIYNANDDEAAISALNQIWYGAKHTLQAHYRVVRIGCYFGGLSDASERQLDLFHIDDARRKKWISVTHVMDEVNNRYGQSVLTIGPWNQQYGRHLGTKIAFTRIPSIEDQL